LATFKLFGTTARNGNYFNYCDSGHHPSSRFYLEHTTQSEFEMQRILFHLSECQHQVNLITTPFSLLLHRLCATQSPNPTDTALSALVKVPEREADYSECLERFPRANTNGLSRTSGC
jgi:hypothetical protein